MSTRPVSRLVVVLLTILFASSTLPLRAAAPLAPTPSYTRVTTLAGKPNGDDDEHDDDDGKAIFRRPLAVAVTPAGDVFVADSKNNEIRRVTPAGVVTIYAGTGKSGYKDGLVTVAQFKKPGGVAYDAARNTLYVSDTGNRRIRKIVSDRTVSTFAGTGREDDLKEPMGLALDAAGNLYVADRGQNRIAMITPAGVMTVVAGGREDGLRNGAASQARFKQPSAVAVAANGALYVADTGNSVIRKIDVAGANGIRQVTTVAGSSREGDHDDDDGEKADFKQPAGIGIDAAGNLLVADSGNSRLRLIDLKKSPVAVTTIAGGSRTGFVDGPALSARFSGPAGLAVAGAVYIA
ncbi:MAG: hypothetical protein JWO56_573, partial [Acidobacteria bacterium]|nr:hypothetical protein [Acidobacteriota bacterium]